MQSFKEYVEPIIFKTGNFINMESDCMNSSNAPWTSVIIEVKGVEQNKIKVEYDDGCKWYECDMSRVSAKVRDDGFAYYKHI